MLTVEDILSILVGHGRWFETGRDDKRRDEFRRFHGILQQLEDELNVFRGRAPELRSLPSAATAIGKQSRNAKSGNPLSSIAAEAIAGMPPIEWASILWIINSDPGAYETCYERLVKIARQSYGRDSYWPRTIRRRRCGCGRHAAEDYVPDLVHLALLELRTPGHFQTHEDRATWFGLSPQHWRKIFDKPYGVLQGRTFTWFGGGCSHIAKRLRMAVVAN